MSNAWVLSLLFFFFFFFITLLSSPCNPTAISDTKSLRYDFYRDSCPQAERIVRFLMSRIYFNHPHFPASLLRLYFHDCFIQGCDASILLDATADNGTYSSEKQALPNLTLKGFDEIDQIKEELEKLCPLVVSCADILTIATRDAVVLSGGPFYPVSTGRRDSIKAYNKEAMAEIPGPDDSINRTLNLFAARGLDERDTVSLLGAHNVGKIGCRFILNRLDNFSGTGQPDKSIDPTYLNMMRSKCQEKEGNNSNQASPAPSPTPKPASGETARRSTLDMSYSQELSSSLSLKGGYSTQYYKSLLSGRGLMYADQQLMANEKTAKLVKGYASDNGSTFRMDFSKAMLKLSALNVLTGSQGVIRERCKS